MRLLPASVLLALTASVCSACALVAKSPALSPPLEQRLAKADTPTIEEAARECMKEGGWTPDEVSGDAEGATVVSGKNASKTRESVYIQAPGTHPRVTGDPAYDDPFWKCLNRQLASGPSTAAASASPPDEPASGSH
jgi:hypothetical protein